MAAGHRVIRILLLFKFLCTYCHSFNDVSIDVQSSLSCSGEKGPIDIESIRVHRFIVLSWLFFKSVSVFIFSDVNRPGFRLAVNVSVQHGLLRLKNLNGVLFLEGEVLFELRIEQWNT